MLHAKSAPVALSTHTPPPSAVLNCPLVPRIWLRAGRNLHCLVFSHPLCPTSFLWPELRNLFGTMTSPLLSHHLPMRRGASLWCQCSCTRALRHSVQPFSLELPQNAGCRARFHPSVCTHTSTHPLSPLFSPLLAWSTPPTRPSTYTPPLWTPFVRVPLGIHAMAAGRLLPRGRHV